MQSFAQKVSINRPIKFEKEVILLYIWVSLSRPICEFKDFHQLQQIQNTVSRVLRPGGSFVFFSFSRPEFLLPKLMMIDKASLSRLGIRKRTPWKNLEVQQLPKILLYRMQKREESDRVDSYVNKRVLNSKPNRRSKGQ